MTHYKRILVCGGRDYNDRAHAFAVLDAFAPTTIIEGGARGADRLAAHWAQGNANRISCPADWDRHGKAAGLIRNQMMLDEHKPDLVLAFPGGRGTADMVRRAQAAGVAVIAVQPRA